MNAKHFLLPLALAAPFLGGCISIPKPTEKTSLQPKTRQESFQSRNMGVNSPSVVETVETPSPQIQTSPETNAGSDAPAEPVQLETQPLVKPPQENPAPESTAPTTPEPQPVPSTPQVPQAPANPSPEAEEASSSSKSTTSDIATQLASEKAKSEQLEQVIKDQNAVITLQNSQISQLKSEQQTPQPTPAHLKTLEKLQETVEQQEEEIQAHKTLLAAEIQKVAQQNEVIKQKNAELTDLAQKHEQLKDTYQANQLEHQEKLDDLKDTSAKEKQAQALQIQTLTSEKDKLAKDLQDVIKALETAEAKVQDLETKSTESPQNPPATSPLPAPPIPQPVPTPAAPPEANSPPPATPAPTAPFPPPPSVPSAHPFAPATTKSPPPPAPSPSPFTPAPPPPPSTNPFAPTGTVNTPAPPTAISPTGGSLPAPPPPPPPSTNPFQ